MRPPHLGKAPRAVALACAAFASASGLAIAAGAGQPPPADAASAPGQVRTGDAGSPPAVPACIRVTTSSRYIPYGYSHVVILANGCASDATCAVSSDVNPEKQTVDVAKGTTAEVVTFLASPQQTFTASVTCKLR